MDYLNLSQLFSGEMEYDDVSPSHLLPSVAPEIQDSEFQIESLYNGVEEVPQMEDAPFNQCSSNVSHICKSSIKESCSTQIDQASVLSQMSFDDTLEVPPEEEPESLNQNSEEIHGNFENNSKVHKEEDKEAIEKIEHDCLAKYELSCVNKKSEIGTRHRKVITEWPHTDQEYYAKGMCRNCYHNKGQRSKKAYKWVHNDRDHYAKGLCKSCYLHFFHIKNKERKANISIKNQLKRK